MLIAAEDASAHALAPPSVAPARDALDDFVLGAFPAPIADAYARFLSEADPRLRCGFLVSAFTTVLKYLALVTAADYLQHCDVRSPVANETLVRGFARPLDSTYSSLIAQALPLLEAKGGPFVRELSEAYDALERRCSTPVLLSKSYEDDHGKVRTRQSKLTILQALLSLRNMSAHGHVLPTEAASERLTEYMPVLRELLRHTRFLSRYLLLAVTSAGASQGRVMLVRLMGRRRPWETEEGTVRGVPVPSGGVFLRDTASGSTLPLYPLGIFDTTSDEVFLFAGNTRSSVHYLASTGARLEQKPPMAHWRRLLGANVDLDVLSAENLSVERLAAVAHGVTDRTMLALGASGTFVSEVPVRRRDVERTLDELGLGDYRGFVLAGTSGSGKSTVLARLVAARREAGDVALFYRAADLTGPEFAERLARDLGLKGLYFEDLLADLDQEMVNKQSHLYVVVDGVEEYPGNMADLVRSLDAMVHQASSHPWVRLVFSVRTASYERLPPAARFGVKPGARYFVVRQTRGCEQAASVLVRLGPLSKEELEQAYEAHRRLRRKDPADPDDPGVSEFRPVTEFRQLDPYGSTVALMQNPAMLRVLMAAFHRRELPSEMAYDQAMALYVEQVVAGRRQQVPTPERLGLLRSLVRLMSQAGVTALPRDTLYDDPRFTRALELGTQDSLYVQLLDLGILEEAWDRDLCLVRVALPRLFEYLLAEQEEDAGASTSALLALALRATEYESLRGALSILLLRACREGHIERVLELLDGCDRSSAARPVVMREVSNVLAHLARAHSSQFSAILERVADLPSRVDVAMLHALFDQLFAHGEMQAAEQVLVTAEREVQSLDNAALEAETRFRRYQLEERGSRIGSALESLRRVRELAVQAGKQQLAWRADCLRGELLARQGNTKEALELLGVASQQLFELGALSEAADARRREAVVAGALGSARRRKPLREALGWARIAQDRRTEGACLNSSGLTEWQLGRYRHAERLFLAAARIAESLGDLDLMHKVECNLGNVAYRDRLDYQSAQGHYQRSLDLARRLGATNYVLAAHINLSLVDRALGQLSSARTKAEQALTLAEQVGARRYVASARMILGLVHAASGELDSARSELTLSVATATELAQLDRIFEARCHLGNALVTLGDLATADPLLGELERSEVDLPHAPLATAALRLRLLLARGAGPSEIGAAAHDLIELRRQQTSPLEPDNRPIQALLEGAAWANEHQDADLARTLLDLARADGGTFVCEQAQAIERLAAELVA